MYIIYIYNLYVCKVELLVDNYGKEIFCQNRLWTAKIHIPVLLKYV